MKTSKKKSVRKVARKSLPKSTRARIVRSPEQSVGREQVYIGIDPANEKSGLAILNGGGDCVWSGTLSVWEPLPDYVTVALGMYIGRENVGATIYYERSPVRGKPANDAISRAAGMLIQNLRNAFFPKLKRSDVHAVEPATWRKFNYGNARPADPKMMAICEFRKVFGYQPETHDQAEAYFIARYGFYQETKGVGSK